MEAFGAFLDEEWESLSKMFSSEDSDLLLHFNEQILFPNKVDNQSFLFPFDASDQTNLYCVSQESSNSSDIESAPFANPVCENGVSFLQNAATNTDFCCGLSVPVFPNDHNMEENVPWKANAENGVLHKETTFNRKYATQEIQTQDNDHSPDQSPKKRPRVTTDNGKKNKTNRQSKRNKKAVQNDEEENVNGVGNGQSSSTCSYEEDDSNCNVSQELNGGLTSESKGKSKAGRGSATDPQSLYARRRRERINERLRILQNLVPNGTKVDISTMLEEAVHYVKFLQLQIKLLSSDDLWMYAPIAYNGMDIGAYQKILPNLLSGN